MFVHLNFFCVTTCYMCFNLILGFPAASTGEKKNNNNIFTQILIYIFHTLLQIHCEKEDAELRK